MKVSEWRKQIENGNAKKALPLLSFPGVQLLGVSVAEMISSSDLQAACIKAVSDRTDNLAAVGPMDLSVEAECFGAMCEKTRDEVPTVIDILVKNEDDADKLVVPDVNAGRTSLYVEGVRKAKNLIKDKPVFGGIIGPYSLAGRLVGVSESMLYCYDEPDLLKKVLEKTTAFLISYAKAYKSAGADGIIIAEPLAGLLSPAMAEEFSSVYTKRIVDSVKSDDFYVIYHNCGNAVLTMMDSLLGIGADAMHFGNAVDMIDVLALVGDATVMGNIDPAGEFTTGTEQSIRKVTADLLEKCGDKKNFVISSGCDIPPAANWNNIDAFFDEVKKYYSKRNK